MALRDQIVDISLIGPDQLPGDHQGGIGRVTDLRNCVIEHFDPANPGKPQFLNLKQRKGMRSLVTTGHSATTGVNTTPAWAGPRLLTSTANGAPLSVVRSKPRVYDGTDFATYDATRVLTNKTTARPVYSAQSVAQAPDKSWLSGVQCHVWTELTNGSNVSSTSVMTVMAGFRGDNGAWIRKPFAVQASADAGDRIMARATNDGTRFWIFATNNGATPQITIYCYDLNGQQLASSNVNMKWAATYTPGYWDIQRRPATSSILLVQPNGDDPDADNHVVVTDCSFNGSVITTIDYVIIDVHCNGPVAWATNFQDNFNYLLTTNFDTGDFTRLWGYRIEFVMPDGYDATHEYNINRVCATTPDTLIGYTEASTDSTPAHKNLVVSVGTPAIGSIYGAAFDPATRYIQSFRCTWADVVTFLRQTNSVCHVSRALIVDDDYYAWTYYQSGGGFQESVSNGITLTGGDYFIGSTNQKIPITAGGTYGAPFTLSPSGGILPDADGPVTNIDGAGTADKVEEIVASGLFQVPDGTILLKWTFKNAPFSPVNAGSIMQVISSSIPGANGFWDIVVAPLSSTVGYTSLVSRNGGTLTPGNFSTAGTVQVNGTVAYNSSFLPDFITQDVKDLFDNGTITLTGASNPGNNGTFTLLPGRIIPDTSVYPNYGMLVPNVQTDVTTQVFEDPTSASAVISPAQPNVWFFSGAGGFTDADEFSSLVISHAAPQPVDNTYDIVSIPTPTSIETDATQTAPVLAQLFQTPLPTVTLTLLPTVTQFTFFLQNVTFDYSYQDAIISVASAQHPSVNGLYRITQIVDAHTVHTIPVTATSGDVRSESLLPDTQDIAILKAPSLFPQIQPQWFLTPLGEVTTSQVGNLELGLAYADWRREGAVATIGAENPYLLHVSTPCIDNDGYTTDLPFRAVTVTEQSATAIGGNVSTNAIAAAVVGVKEFKLYSTSYGQVNNGLIPGPMAAVYDGGSFVESGILTGAEQPTLQSEQSASNPALVKNGIYSYVACWEAIDATGNRIWTAPSPALQVQLTGSNDSATISGRLPIPLNSSGVNQAGSSHFGLSNRPMIVLSLYRSCIQNGLQTTAHYKITDDLAPNAITPISTSNSSGFTFPDEFTWTYKDENLDSVVLSNEQLYTDRGLLPRFHAPAFHNGATNWQERDWLNAYDGAIWFSGQPAEGEAVWYSPLFRIPAPFEPTAIGNLGSFLAGFSSSDKWYLPTFRPPLNNGQLSNIPAWLRLNLEGGCTGIAIPVRGGVAYSSNFGGVWYLSSQLADEWTSRDLIDSFDGKTITAMTVDSKQRLVVAVGTTDLFVYDQVAKRWSRWPVGSATNITLLATCAGTLHIQNNACIAYYDTSLARDIMTGVETGTPLGFTMASLNFANVVGVKKMRMIQLRGKYKAEHKLAVAISYPDQNAVAPTTTMQLFTPDPTKPYVLDAYPGTEEASSYGLVVDASFSGVATPGDSFELDVIGAQVAIDGRSGINKSTQQISNG